MIIIKDNNNNDCIAVKSSFYGNHFLNNYITKNNYLRNLFATSKHSNHIHCDATIYGYKINKNNTYRYVLVPICHLDIINFILNQDLNSYDVWNNINTIRDEKKSGKIVVKRILKEIRKYKREVA